jgi:hypothetical protein
VSAEDLAKLLHEIGFATQSMRMSTWDKLYGPYKTKAIKRAGELLEALKNKGVVTTPTNPEKAG